MDKTEIKKYPAPIALFVYNRPDHTRQTVEALKKNILSEESDLFIFSDGPKDDLSGSKVKEVRNYLKTVSGFKSVSVIEREKNIGLAASIISGVTEIVNKFGTIIVVEDDLVTSPFFLSYMNQGLKLYEKEEKVASIHGYVYPTKDALPETFFIKGADCWGWATWKRAWENFEPDGQKLYNRLVERCLEKEFNFENTFDYMKMLRGQIVGRNNSWAIRWYASAFLADMLTLYPGKTLVENIGFDGSGTHSTKGLGQKFFSESESGTVTLQKIAVIESATGRQAFERYFAGLRPGRFSRILNRFRLIFKKLSKHE